MTKKEKTENKHMTIYIPVEIKNLTQKDVNYFLGAGHPLSDLPQLDRAFKEANLTMKDVKSGRRRKISCDKAIEIIGRDRFLSGISRAAFHLSAARCSQDENFEIYFDLSKWL